MAIGLVAQRGNERAIALADEIRDAFEGADVEVRIDPETAEDLGVDEHDLASFHECALVVSIGGDGTFLYTARGVGNTPIVGVNLGEVGFLNAVSPADAPKLVPDLYERALAGDVRLQTLSRVIARGDGWTVGPGLNEILVHAAQRGHPGGVTATVTVDGRTYTRDRVDGVMVATPTGSTAYNLSEDGPLLTPSIDGLVVNPMCGRDPMPPLVVPQEATIEITIEDAPHGHVISDGRMRRQVAVPTSVIVERAETPVRIAGPPLEFFEALGKLE